MRGHWFRPTKKSMVRILLSARPGPRHSHIWRWKLVLATSSSWSIRPASKSGWLHRCTWGQCRGGRHKDTCHTGWTHPWRWYRYGSINLSSATCFLLSPQPVVPLDQARWHLIVLFFLCSSKGEEKAQSASQKALPLHVLENSGHGNDKSQTEKNMIELTYLRMSLWFCMALRFCSLNLDFLSLFWTMASSLVGALVGM